MSSQKCHAAQRTALAGALLTLTFSVANATGPETQVVTVAQQNANLRSVVRFTDVNNNVALLPGSGSIIDKFVLNEVGYFCVLTADHVIADPALTRVNLGNVGVEAGFTIVDRFRKVAGGNVDIGLALVRYGAPDARFNGIVGLTLANAAIPIGNTFSQVGFGVRGNRVNNGNGDYIGLDQQADNTAGIKRYQNNNVSNRVVNFNAGAYQYRAVQFDFDAAVDNTGAATNRDVGGEGFSFNGDSGSPLFSSAIHDLDGPDVNVLPTLFTNTIVAIDTFGPGGAIRDGARESGPDVAFYRNSIIGGCQTLMASLSAPEPGSIALMLLGMGGIGIVIRRRVR